MMLRMEVNHQQFHLAKIQMDEPEKELLLSLSKRLCKLNGRVRGFESDCGNRNIFANVIEPGSWRAGMLHESCNLEALDGTGHTRTQNDRGNECFQWLSPLHSEEYSSEVIVSYSHFADTVQRNELIIYIEKLCFTWTRDHEGFNAFKDVSWHKKAK